MRLRRMKQDIQGLNLNDGNNYLVLKAIYFLYIAFFLYLQYLFLRYTLDYVFDIKKTSFPLIAIIANIYSDDDVVDSTC